MPGTPRLGLSVKVGLILFVVVAGALAIVYFAVVPQLESRLVDAKIEELDGVAPTVAASIRGRNRDLQTTVAAVGETLDVRVVVFRRLTDDQLLNVADSRRFQAGDVAGDPVALEALTTGLPASGRVARGGEDYAEVARRLDADTVLVIAASLQDALANVQLVRRTLIVAGAASLAVSWLAGYLLAWRFTRRIRRLEGAAERLAAGDFETRVVDTGRDEVAQLAAAFDGMRVRLAALDRARNEFIANASHELRTPLFSLGGFLELLADEEMDEAVRRDFLGEMRGQVERLTRLATDLLDLSRLDAGQLRVERVPVDLAAAARVVAEEFRALADAQERDLELRADGPVEALGDEQRVQQIVRALVENAMRHTPPGTAVALTVAGGDGRASVAVQDDGPG
ncbi:MAG TPA: histidine kinase dimerization/phospho-acceptor domain-containing protein, partial [Gaiellaceae bacterium]|nr:histidine kinase dimerization/phospho-acceptor domain-containing protein [Gaiellaceae bacterium]